MPTPLEGQLYLESFARDTLGDDFLHGLYSLLTYQPDGTLPVMNAVGRNYYIPLPHKIGPYTGVQVAGGGNSEMGIRSNSDARRGLIAIYYDEASRIITPPSAGGELFTGYTQYYEGGKIVEKANPNPLGSYSHQSAERKIANTLEARKALRGSAPKVLTPRFLGKFEYDIPDQNGEPQTAILMLVPDMGRRFDVTLLEPLRFAYQQGIVVDLNDYVLNHYADKLRGSFAILGLGIASLHAVGLNHNQLTPGNMAVVPDTDQRPRPYIADWDTLTHPTLSDARRARARDMLLTINTSVPGLMTLTEGGYISPEVATHLAHHTIVDLLKGYLQKFNRNVQDVVSSHDTIGRISGLASPLQALDIVVGWLEATDAIT